MSVQDPIRQQLIAARRNQILEAAAVIFAEKGFHRATTKEIASTAGISEGTIYNYFESKQELLIGIMEHLAEVETLSEEFVEALKGDVRDFFVTMFHHRMGHMERAQEMMQAILPEVMVNPKLRELFYQQFVLRLATLLEQYVEARIELEHIRPVDAELAARALQSMVIGLLIFRILGDEPLLSKWEDVPEVVATMIFDGLRPRKGE